MNRFTTYSKTNKHREGGKGGDIQRPSPALGFIPVQVRVRVRVRVGHYALADYFCGLKGRGRKRIHAREHRIDGDVGLRQILTGLV